MNKSAILLAASVFALGACDGPQEDAGEVADNAAGVVSSEDSLESGPNETLGEVRDEAAESANEAREARADALEDRAEQAREEADARADALDERAQQTREGR